jgi:hypothetical protein
MIFTIYPYHVVLVPKTKKTKRQRTWDKLPVWIKKPPDSSRGHKISTRNGSVIGSDLIYRFFGILDRSSQGVFVSKNQTKVTSPFNHPRESPFHPPLYFRSPSELPTPQDCQRNPLVPNLAASTFIKLSN